MAKRGRKPRAVTLKLLRGERSDRLPGEVSEQGASAPVAPRHLDASGRAAWNRNVKLLGKEGPVVELDGELLALYCEAYSRYRSAVKDIRKNGVLAPTQVGGTKQNPSVAIAAQAEAIMAKLLGELRLGVRARGQLRAKPADALEVFLARRLSGRGE